MIPGRAILLFVASAPLAALAQVSYSEVRIVPDRIIVVEAVPACLDPRDALFDRKARLDSEKLDNDRESEAIARAGAQLSDELRRLDSTNAAAVADYNARSDAHNRRVDAHNRRVADMNGAVAVFNRDAADANARCFPVREYRVIR